jgi:alkylated DNA repair protein (DNA oxidative demethylase)
MTQTVQKIISEHSFIMPGFATMEENTLLTTIEQIEAQAPFRQMSTPRGFKMAAQMTNCGDWGWVTDRRGYRYQQTDPETGRAWPELPDSFKQLAQKAASLCGFDGFEPDVCLINRYQPGAGMGLHQDKDEKDFSAPIVSVSLGVPAIFLFGGHERRDKPEHYLLQHGDVVVWGNQDRLRFHGIQPVKLAHHPLTGQYRYNLTFRRAF